ncbi:hypothetical protein GCM10010389_09000 [Streptomyces echinoruber]|uniref:Uncharacterized protein n=1 Tax=Streptomyces echinoruber TaxID=68898 RepID=A0A918QV41_9ACTN|nr:hypothetical protein GCM10010389_09000 [Streptomyces echinoruber]
MPAKLNDEGTEAPAPGDSALPAKARLHPIETEIDETGRPTHRTHRTAANETTEWPSLHHSTVRRELWTRSGLVPYLVQIK